ncbi:MAG TPA: ABC transporter permease [Clostridia bacterium]|nr:MAG: Oligopeptide transport system permease protein OppB [Firmicutes bacterium ADurb.Bin248]HOF99674.1 ABC transporter permease [Clostridia bacterium]HOQ63012.1 ABC transporter permease [Clostridia bacterium]HPK15920.1 ABC transporter permease [Clostridia bacterium]
MLKYILQRFLRALLSLFIIVTTIFCLLRLMPIEGYLGPNWEKMSKEVIAAKLAAKGLDKPVPAQLFDFYKALFNGDLGKSWIYRENYPITKIIMPKMAVSARLGAMAMALSLLLGIPLGASMARSKGKWPDRMGTAFVVLIQAAPSAIYFLFIQMYATSGTGIPMLYNARAPISWILPIISLALPSIASYGMWMRRYMVDAINQDYVKLARAKGIPERSIMMRHVFRNAFVPMVQLVPSSLLYTIMGSLYVESIYSIPGMGGLLIDVIQRQDNTMVQALVLIFSGVGILGLFLGDVMMALVDPRINLQRKEESR